jgi:hypothetical protein
MRITDNVVEHLNYQLDDLHIDGTSRFTTDDFLSTSTSMDDELVVTIIAKFTGTIKILMDEFKTLDDSILDIPENASLDEVTTVLSMEIGISILIYIFSRYSQH